MFYVHIGLLLAGQGGNRDGITLNWFIISSYIFCFSLQVFQSVLKTPSSSQKASRICRENQWQNGLHSLKFDQHDVSGYFLSALKPPTHSARPTGHFLEDDVKFMPSFHHRKGFTKVRGKPCLCCHSPNEKGNKLSLLHHNCPINHGKEPHGKKKRLTNWV